MIKYLLQIAYFYELCSDFTKAGIPKVTNYIKITGKGICHEQYLKITKIFTANLAGYYLQLMVLLITTSLLV